MSRISKLRGPSAALWLLIQFLLWLPPLLFQGCAVPPKFPAGEALLKGETPKLPPPPDSLRAELELTAFNGGRKSSVSAAFSAVPYRFYKLDLFGLPGMVGGSFYWTRPKWTLVLFERDAYLEGSGPRVALRNLGIEAVSVHDVFSFLWGNFFPGRDGAGKPEEGLAAHGESGAGLVAALPTDMERKADGSLRYAADHARWMLHLDAATGLVRETLRDDSTFRISYGEYRLQKDRPMPRRVRIYTREGLILEIKVKSVEDNPAWHKSPFFIKVPKGFKPLDPANPG